jgi:hypothetical protein
MAEEVRTEVTHEDETYGTPVYTAEEDEAERRAERAQLEAEEVTETRMQDIRAMLEARARDEKARLDRYEAEQTRLVTEMRERAAQHVAAQRQEDAGARGREILASVRAELAEARMAAAAEAQRQEEAEQQRKELLASVQTESMPETHMITTTDARQMREEGSRVAEPPQGTEDHDEEIIEVDSLPRAGWRHVPLRLREDTWIVAWGTIALTESALRETVWAEETRERWELYATLVGQARGLWDAQLRHVQMAMTGFLQGNPLSEEERGLYNMTWSVLTQQWSTLMDVWTCIHARHLRDR